MGAATAILVIIFIIGTILLIHSFIVEATVPITERDIAGNIYEKIAGIILMIIPIGIGLGWNSGTGKPYGGRRYKGGGGYSRDFLIAPRIHTTLENRYHPAAGPVPVLLASSPILGALLFCSEQKEEKRSN